MNLLGIIGIWQILLASFILIFLIILPIAALIDVLRDEFSGNDKVIWGLVILLFPVMGAILYFLIGSKKSGFWSMER